MESVAVFIEKPSSYEDLAAPNRRVEVVLFEAAASAWECAMDLAIIDCDNNVDAGLRILKSMKQSRADVPVIFITEASSEAVVMRAFKLGARDYFRKPLDQFEFKETVARILVFKRDQVGKSPGPAGNGEGKFSALFHLPAGLPERLLRAVSYMNDNLTAHLSLDAVARHACLSKYHFSRLFKRHVGVSPMRYSLYRRIMRACEILSSPSQTITLTAFKSGFNDVSEFIRQFRSITGVTPGAYRKSLLKPVSPE